MLILTRRVGETLMIGDSVSVTVLGVKGNQVRIGITAPKDVAVHRSVAVSMPRLVGAPGRIRTSDPQVRSLVLYPAELRAPSRKSMTSDSLHVNFFVAISMLLSIAAAMRRYNWRRRRDSNPRWSF